MAVHTNQYFIDLQNMHSKGWVAPGHGCYDGVTKTDKTKDEYATDESNTKAKAVRKQKR